MLVYWQFEISPLPIEILNELLNALNQHGGQISPPVLCFLHLIIEYNFSDIIIAAGNFQQSDRRVIVCGLDFRHLLIDTQVFLVATNIIK